MQYGGKYESKRAAKAIAVNCAVLLYIDKKLFIIIAIFMQNVNGWYIEIFNLFLFILLYFTRITKM